MCGCDSAAMARASRSNRWRDSRVRRDERGQHLDRDRAIEAHVAGAIHFAHPAGAEHALDLIRAESGARCQCHRGED